MSTLIDLPTKPADQAETNARLSSYLESWRSSLTSTERADRPAAEAAVEGLYRNIGRARPRILWVASPLAGALAYQSICTTPLTLTSPYAKGDVGTGANRHFHGLRDPFGFPTYVESEAPERLLSRASEQVAAIERIRDSASRTTGAIRAVLGRRTPEAIHEQEPVNPSPVAVDEQLGVLLMGSSAETFSRLVGPEAFSMVAGLAVRQSFVARLGSGLTSWATQAMQPGQFDADTLHWAALEVALGLPFHSPRDGSTASRERLALRLQAARAAGPWWALDGLAIVSERPLALSVDAEGRLHAEGGPALAFGDGFTVHAWHGVTVEREVIEEPDTITIESIDKEHNAERRRVLVERFGFDRLVSEGRGTLRHEDETGRLWELPMGRITWSQKDEPVVMVEVLNSTPEPDGSRKTYFLRVPPQTRSAREAVAWTFGLGKDQYAPRWES